MNEAEADSMIEAARTSGRPLCVMHNHMFDTAILKADDLIRSTPGNDPFLVRVTYFVERRKLEEEGDLDPKHWINHLPLGIYGEHGAPHVLYILLKWLKRASDVAISEMHVKPQTNGPIRLWNVTLHSEDCMGMMALGDHTSIGQFVVELFTPLMVIKLNLLDLTWSIYRERGIGLTTGRMAASVEESVRRLLSSTGNLAAIATGRLKRRPGHRGLVKAFYDSIRDGQPSPVPPEEGREVVKVLKWLENKVQAGQAGRTEQQPTVQGPI
jgi:predicted dehydrogenase